MKDTKKLNLKEMEKVTGGAESEEIEMLAALGIEADPDAVALPSATSSMSIEQYRRIQQLQRIDDLRIRTLRNHGVTVRRRPRYPLA